MLDWINSVVDSFKDWVGNLIGKLFYSVEALLAKCVGLLYDTFEVLAGISPVVYKGQKVSITDVFFSRKFYGGTLVTNVYWSLALVGMALAIGFAIAAVIKKSFDLDSENKLTHGKILMNLFKSIFLMFLMSSIIVIVMDASAILLKSITTAFDEAHSGEAMTVTVNYSDKDYADMARIMDTIGSYSLNPSYNSRYNLNSCYNDIREDLLSLKKAGKFEYPYLIDKSGQVYWQYALQQLMYTVDLEEDQPANIYNRTMSPVLLEIMEHLKNDKGFKALSKYTYVVSEAYEGGNIDIDRMIMVIGTLDCARNKSYNGPDQNIMDDLRRPYTLGYKNVFDFDQMKVDFYLYITRYDYVTVTLLIIFLLYSFLGIVINCGARIFNMIYLYLILPFAASTMPYDAGAKLKQWTTAFIIQSFSLFGSIIGMELFMMMFPIIYDSSLVFSDHLNINWFIKAVIIVSFGISTAKASSLLSGILAENAGMQAVMAGDIAHAGRGMMMKSAGMAFDAPKTVGKWLAKNPQGNNPQGNNPQGNNQQGNNQQGNNQQGNNQQGNNPPENNPPHNNRELGNDNNQQGNDINRDRGNQGGRLRRSNSVNYNNLDVADLLRNRNHN